MAISIQCQCSRVITVNSALAGQPTRCPSCGRRHVVPQPRPEAPVAPMAPQGAPLSGTPCRECGVDLIHKSAFCHNCGLPTVEHDQTAPAYPAMAAPYQSAPQHQPAPMVAPQPQMAPPQMAQPFTQQQESAEQQAFAKHQATKTEQPKTATPLGNLAMACAYISMLLGIVSVGLAIPMIKAAAGDCSGGGCGIAMTAENSGNLINLQYAILALIGLFSMFGIFTGFLGMFHVGRKRGVAVWGLVICFLLGAFASGAFKKIKQYDNRMEGESIVRTMENPEPMYGCPAGTNQEVVYTQKNCGDGCSND